MKNITLFIAFIIRSDCGQPLARHLHHPGKERAVHPTTSEAPYPDPSHHPPIPRRQNSVRDAVGKKMQTIKTLFCLAYK